MLSGKLGFEQNSVIKYNYTMEEGTTNISFKAVAFDLDGTLYPNYRLYRRLLPLLLVHPFFYSAFMKTRSRLHADQDNGADRGVSFYDRQASFVAQLLKEDKEEIRQKINHLVYGSWERLFSGIKLFPFVKETLTDFRDAGLRLAILSDFPPVQKISLMGLNGFFDVILSTEETGALKPSGIPFAALIKTLNFDPKEILYVGNSLRYDVEGAKSAGINAALIRRSPFSTGHVPGKSAAKADFVFRDYRQLREYVLG